MGPRARANAMDVADEELHALYQWVDEIPLSRPKRNIARDFSDGVLVAELVSHYLPRFIDLHNYSGASNVTQKLYNWQTLNDKVFRRLGFSLGQRERENTANCKPGAIERVLKLVKVKIARHRARQGGGRGRKGAGFGRAFQARRGAGSAPGHTQARCDRRGRAWAGEPARVSGRGGWGRPCGGRA